MNIEGKRNNENVLYYKLKSVYYNMMHRCYKKYHKAYKNYGEKGVYVSEEWNTLSKFIETIDLVEGWNLDKFLNGELTLDKDSLFKNNKIYSINTCKFMSTEENNKHKPNQQKLIMGISPNNDVYEFYNQSEFARIHNLSQSCINHCVKGVRKTHKKWKFKYL